MFHGFVNYCCRALYLTDVCWGPGYNSRNSGTLKKCNRKKLQHAKSLTREECKTKTLQLVKVHHEIVQYIKIVQGEKKCNMERYLHK